MAFQVAGSFLSVKIVLEGWPFDPKLFRSFLSKERIMAQEYFREMGNLVNMPQGIKDDFKVSRSWGLCFWSSMGFDRLETVASLDAYQITNFSFFQKLIIFVV